MTTDHDVRQAMLARSSQHGIDVDAVSAGIDRGVRRRRHQRRAVTGIGAVAAVAALAVGVPSVDGLVSRTGAPTTSLSPAASTTPSPHREQGPRLDRSSGQDQEAAWEAAGRFSACYTSEDAEVLAAQWKSPSVMEAKVAAGKMLIAGQSLPVQPSRGAAIAAGGPVPGGDCDALSQQQEDFALEFTDQGYTWDDAKELARLWGSPDTLSAKVQAGEALRSNVILPIAPGSASPAPGEPSTP